MTELDVIKLAAISLPKHILTILMPSELQADSVDINRMRSCYIKTMLTVWKLYGRAVIGTTCPVFGTFTQEGEILPSNELAEAVSISINK